MHVSKEMLLIQFKFDAGSLFTSELTLRNIANRIAAGLGVNVHDFE